MSHPYLKEVLDLSVRFLGLKWLVTCKELKFGSLGWLSTFGLNDKLVNSFFSPNCCCNCACVFGFLPAQSQSWSWTQRALRDLLENTVCSKPCPSPSILRCICSTQCLCVWLCVTYMCVYALLYCTLKQWMIGTAGFADKTHHPFSYFIDPLYRCTVTDYAACVGVCSWHGSVALWCLSIVRFSGLIWVFTQARITVDLEWNPSQASA